MTEKVDNPIDNPAVNAVTGNFSLQAQLPNGKSFSVSGYLYDGESVESVNQRVDLVHDVLDRQRIRAEIPELEAKRDQMLTALDQMKTVMLELETKKSAGKSLTSQEKMTLQNISVSIGKVQDDISKGTEAISEAKKKTGVA